MTDTQLAILLFVVLWVATFIPAWYFLGKLVVYSINPRKGIRSATFWINLLIYLAIIVLPYVPLLIFGDSLHGLIQAIIVAVIALGIAIALARIFLAKFIDKMLWGAYGYVYDGLLYFYPYKHLLQTGVKRLDIKPSDSVLDLGCGTGNASLLILKNRPKHLLASDNSKSMMRPIKRKLADFDNVTITRQDAVRYLKTLPSKSLDKILLVNVLYAVHDRKTLWLELFRVLKDNGRIVMTSSDKGGSSGIIREHLRHASFWQLLHPKLLGVFIIDNLITAIATSGSFHFISKDEMLAEIQAAGGKAEEIERCYGGEINGVNLMMTVLKA